VDTAAQLCDRAGQAPIVLHPTRFSAAAPVLTLLLDLGDSVAGWVWAGDRLALPSTETARSSEVQTLVCIRESLVETGRYTNGQPAMSRNWLVNLLAWPDGALINTTTLDSPPPVQVEGLAVGVGEPPIEALLTWAENPPGGRKVQLWSSQMGQAVHQVIGSPDGQVLAVGLLDGQIRVLDAVTGKQLQAFSRDEPMSGAGISARWGRIAFSADGQTVYGRMPTKIVAWDVKTGQVRQTFEMPFQATDADGRPTDVRFVSEDRFLAITTSAAGIVKVWDVVTGQVLNTFTGPREITSTTAFWPWVSPDLQTVAVVESPEARLTLWDLNTGETLHELNGQNDPLSILPLFSPDGVVLAAVEDQVVVLWEIATGQIQATLRAESFHFNRTAFSPDGAFLVGCDLTADGHLRVWDTITGKEVLETPTAYCFWQFRIERPGLVVIGETHDLEFWNLATATQTRAVSLPVFGEGLALLPGETTLAVWDNVGTVQVWDILAGE